MSTCTICEGPLDDPGDPATRSCGGDCLRCMAVVAEDPDAIRGMKDDVPGWWDSLDDTTKGRYQETMDGYFEGREGASPSRRSKPA